MNKITIFSKETGEVFDISEPMIRLPRKPRAGERAHIKLVADANGNADLSKMRVYPIQTKDEDAGGEASAHPLYGNCSQYPVADIEFTRCYRGQTPGFSTGAFSSYWLIIVDSLQMNTNVVMRRVTTGARRKVRSVEDLAALLDCGITNAYAFRNECEAKGYMRYFECGDEWQFAVDPRIASNGNKIPEVILSLFEKGEKLGGKD